MLKLFKEYLHYYIRMGCIFSKTKNNNEQINSNNEVNNKRKIDSSPEGVSKRVKSTERFQRVIER
tara:strand:- start:421 stop:615 length:195 start_codon:yes stop_codon:yes gene_type:complete